MATAAERQLTAGVNSGVGNDGDGSGERERERTAKAA
jgi:hypothetical protein